VNATDLRDMDEDELRDHIATARRELFGLRFQHATGELDNTSGLQRARREIARALTVARERGIDAAGGALTTEIEENDG
jgi:large subunit ribosomal protein L29